MNASDNLPNPQIELSAYAGRWVAISTRTGLVGGSGESEAQALALARRNRPKEGFTLHFVEPLALAPLLAHIRPILSSHSTPVYLVGGAVRDAVIGRPSPDLDFVVAHGAIKLTFIVADALGVPAYVLDRERDIGRVMVAEQNTMLDFARLRGDDLLADLRDRDYTLNAMALPVAAITRDAIIDPTGGLPDLAANVLRPTHPASVVSDPVRGLRGVRMALQFGLTLSEDAQQQMALAAQRLADGAVSAERVRDELLKIVQMAHPDQAVALMQRHQLLAAILPEIDHLETVAQSAPHFEAVGPHTRRVLFWITALCRALWGSESADFALDLAPLQPYAAQMHDHFERRLDGGLSGWTVLRLGALFHDVGKSATQTVEDDGRIRFLGHAQVGADMTAVRLEALRLSNKVIEHVKQIVAGHMRPLLLAQHTPISRRAIYRYFKATETAGIDIGLLALADHLATYDGSGGGAGTNLVQVVADLFEHYFSRPNETVKPPPLLNGRDLMDALALPPGPEIGRILRLLEEAQAIGDVNTREEALIFIRQATS